MMTTDKSLFIWAQNNDWWGYTEDYKVFLKEGAPKEAKESYERFKRITKNPNYL